MLRNLRMLRNQSILRNQNRHRPDVWSFFCKGNRSTSAFKRRSLHEVVFPSEILWKKFRESNVLLSFEECTRINPPELHVKRLRDK